MILMAVLAAPQAWKAWRLMRGEVEEGEQTYYLASDETRVSYGTLYLGLAGFLAVMCHELHLELPRGF